MKRKEAVRGEDRRALGGAEWQTKTNEDSTATEPFNGSVWQER